MDKKNILVVDDTPHMRALITRVLSGAGFEVTVAADGPSAVSAIGQGRFDAAIVDYDIPVPNGLEVLARLRECQTHCARVLISGELELEVVLDAVNRGEVNRVLGKPFEPDSLLATLREALDMQDRASRLHEEDLSHEAEHLRQCFDNGLLQLALQPIVQRSKRSVMAYEALLRSSHPVLDGPLPILRAVERHNQIEKLGSSVTQRAAECLKDMPEHCRLFVNLHPRELSDPEELGQRLAPLSPFAERVVFEITERSKVLDVGAWEASTHLVSEMGFSIAVDDLGAGYSSLSVLAELQPQFIKVDMSIIRNIHQSAHKQRLLDLLCHFAEATSAQVIAEGIENEAEASAVEEAGVHMLQGYFFGKPRLDWAAHAQASGAHSRARLSA